MPTEAIIAPSTVIKLEGLGFPDPDRRGAQRGDLYISFDVQFPDFVPQENKEKLRRILSVE